MSSFCRWSLAAVLTFFVAACSPPPPPPPDITLTATPDSILGDGVSTSVIDVSRPGAVDVTLRIARGTFKETGKNSVVITGGTGSATLVSCDSSLGSVCSGSLAVRASSDDDAVGEVKVLIGQREICNDANDNDNNGQTDCADSFCVAKTCSRGDAGVRVCDTSGQCVCASGTVEDCTNGVDDNCDGKIDCADTTCDQKACNVAIGVGGRCSMNTCSCTPGAEICSDNLDNDCDGKIDCADLDCRATTSMLGKVCNATTGLTCSQPDSQGASNCSVCPGGTGPEAATLCADGLDNDCDGTPDCFDTDCANRNCRSTLTDAGVGNGWACDLASAANDKCACTGNGGVAQVSETTCDDGFDNDCDGKADCADSDCLTGGGQTCGTFGKKCLSLNTCGCGATQENCRTSQDDDCDGLINCEEISCRPSGTGFGQVCDDSGNTCSQVLSNQSTCTTCTGNGGVVEASEGSTGGASITCGDGKDNDCDSTQANPSIDCQDSNCLGRACSANGGVCNSLKQCGCPGGLSNEQALCNDGLDNDCDGRIDCLDSDCQPIGTGPGSACGAGNGRTCTAAGLCSCSGNGGMAQATESICSDGRDNDCDGRADCTDNKCQPVGNQSGKICDLSGNTCSNLTDAGVSGCNVCSGNGGQVQTSEFSCGDGFDNDCDGRIDCQDPKCGALACSSSGKRCSSSTLTCVCTGPEALAETTCSDGLDNDCDGLADCTDPNCQPVSGQQARSCSNTGKFCTATSACACNGNGGTVEANEGATTGQATCGDGFDNDCDGMLDCLDPDCKATTVGNFGRDCSRGAVFGAKCDFSGVCLCPGGQGTEATCNDGTDNDCDGVIDCGDSNCSSQLCTTNGNGRRCTGSPASCACPSGLSSEVPIGPNPDSCGNGTDDDCDGLSDCLDPDCQGSPGQLCLPSSPSYRCLLRGAAYVCADQSALFSVTVTSTPIVTPPSQSPNAIPADGTSQTTIRAQLRDSAGALVTTPSTMVFSISSGLGTLSQTSVNSSTGTFTTVYTAPPTQGTATVTATYNAVSGSTTLALPRLGQIKFLTQQHSVMGVRSSSFRETNLLTFQLLDTNSQTYPPGLVVTFTHQPFGGSYLGSVANCTGTNPVTCTSTGVTDNTGFVSVLLHSGTTASVVSVNATATAGGATANATASNIAIVGAKATALRISLDCTPKNIPALTNTNCTNSFYPANITCRVAFADRFNNVLGVSTLATFNSEAGAAGTPTTTPEYSPGNANLGTATGFVSVAGYSLPVDVAPVAGESSATFATSCGTRVHNPRDGLVTVIVSSNGEEGFVDANSNGLYDSGEAFLDQGEPYVDANDNGLHDPSEQFVDTNTNNAYNGPNGVWDANTVIWTETRVLYSGYSAVYSDATASLSRFYDDPGTAPPRPGSATSLVVPAMGSTTVSARFMDENLNYPAQATTYACTVQSPATGVTATFAPPPSQFDTLGMAFTQQFCDASATPVCGNQCQSARTPRICYLRSSVSGYSYGNGGTISVTSSTNFSMGPSMAPQPLGLQCNATLNGVTQPIFVGGTCN